MSLAQRRKNSSVSAAAGSFSGGSNGMFSPPLNGSTGDLGNGGIEGIQIGGVANTLAQKTASLANPQTLYQMCLDIRKRLRNVHGFERFLELPPEAPRMDVVTHIWSCLRLGSSLCHLYNMLLPTFEPNSPSPITFEFPDFDYPYDNGVLTWGTSPQNIKKCKKGAAHFIMNMTALRKEGRWPETDGLWAIHELFGDDTGGLVKVLRTIGLLLDQLPASAWVGDETLSPQTPYPGVNSADRGFGHGPNGSISNGKGYANSSVSSVQTVRPPSSTSTSQPTHRSTYSTSSQGGPSRPGYDTPPLTGTMPSGGAAGRLHINTALDRTRSYGSNGGSMGNSDYPLSALPDGARNGDARPINCGESAMQVWELLKTEKEYVRQLEVLQSYAQALSQSSVISADTVHLMFSNLSKLLDFQRRFLTQLETEYEPVVEEGGNAWVEGRWGYPWVSFEEDFTVYEPYCANYKNALLLVEDEKETLSRLSLPLDYAQLMPYMIMPVQRLCRYPLLLENLVKSSANTDYRYKDELAKGYSITKRIADGVNETLRQHENIGLVEELKTRVKDWKGHVIDEFGKLILDGQFIITKSDQDRDYAIYLFEKMILCCKEVIPEKKDKRAVKSGSILKKQNGSDKGPPPGPSKKNPLSLKGRIYVNNLTKIEKTGENGEYSLKINWRQQEDPGGYEFFVMHVKSLETVNKWESEIEKLMSADQARRDERQRLSQQSQTHPRQYSQQYIPNSANFPLTPASERPSTGPLTGGFFPDQDGPWDEDGGTPSTSASHAPSSRRTMSSQGIPHPSENRYSASSNGARASAGDYGNPMSQWSNQPAMPPLPRGVSSGSTRTDNSYGNGHRMGSRQVSGSSGLGRGQSEEALPYLVEGEEVLRPSMAEANARFANGLGMTRNGSYANQSSVPHPHPGALRNRSASSPNVYQVPRMTSGPSVSTPPLPGSAAMTANSSNQSWSTTDSYAHSRNTPHLVDHAFNPSNLSLTATSETANSEFNKRSSNGSDSTELSDVSSRSPETPYDRNQRDLVPVQPGSRAGSGDSTKAYAASVIVKVHFNGDVFKLAVASDTSYASLVDKVTRKVKLCGGCSDDSLVRVYYKDEDDTLLRLMDDEDLITLFEPFMKGLQQEVELRVKISEERNRRYVA